MSPGALLTALLCLATAQGMASPTRTFHRRPLPAPAVAFSSEEGQRLFAEALAFGGLKAFFRLIEQFHTQGEPAYCGLGTLAMVLNALDVDPERVWKGPWRWFSESLLDCCEPLEAVKEHGITFSKVACLARCNGAHVEAYRAEEPDVTLEAFRDAVRAACEGDAFQVVVVSYSRKALGQTGDGHYSPLGGYHKDTDQVLILDVARFKYPPHWVPLPLLFEAMGYVDAATQRSRGFMTLRSKAMAKASRLALAWRWPECSAEAKNVDGTMSGCFKSFCDTLKGAPADAAEALRRALRFIDSDRMPLAVVYKTQGPAELAKALEALESFAESLEAMGVASPRPDKEDPGSLPAALAIPPAWWQRALATCAEDAEAQSSVWATLEPLLSPETLREEVKVLRCQWADLLTAREEMCGSPGGQCALPGGCGKALRGPQ